MRGLLLSALCVALATVEVRGQVKCSSGTVVTTPYLYRSKNETATCADLISAAIDWYNQDFRAECARVMGGALPERIDNSYISECKPEGDQLKYRAQVCCMGQVTSLRCVTCANAENDYTCNYQGTISDCNGECFTRFTYEEKDSICPRRITKGCIAPNQCQALTQENAARCRHNTKDPQCGFCYTNTLGNWNSPATNSFMNNCKGKDPNSGACATVRCTHGVCAEDTTQPNGWRCDCHPYGVKDATGTCSKTICDVVSPCKNGGKCESSNTEPFYTCCCKAGFYGQNCQETYPRCSGYCKNGGTCYNQGSSGNRCVCPPGFAGDTCQINTSVACFGAEHVASPFSGLGNNFYDKTCNTYPLASLEQGILFSCYWKMKRPDGPLYKGGTHGDELTSLEYIGLNTCNHGDKCGWLTYKACCPSCMSAPCQNGGWCVQKSDHDFVCKCRFGYEGRFCENKVAMCVTSGDPHYRMFDGEMVHYQGECKYQMTAPLTSYDDLPAFQVLTKNERRGGSAHAAWPKYLEVTVYGKVIRLGKGNVVTIDGSVVDLDYTGTGFTVRYNGRFVRLETDFSLVVEFDGNWIGIIKLPAVYKGKVGGLCGNYDDDSTNDYVTREGSDVTNADDRYNQIGNSWVVPDEESENCPSQDGPDPECPADAQTQAPTAGYCGYITSSAQGAPFAGCVVGEPSLAANYFGNCEYDVCLTWNDDPKDTACNSLESFVDECRAKGYPPVTDWRDVTNCPLACPVGMVYTPRGSACHDTCENPRASQECGQQDTEGCRCPDGKLRLGNSCVERRECGCKDGGLRRTIGTSWLSSDCSTRFSCDECTSCDVGVGVITSNNYACAANEQCLTDATGSPICQVITTPAPSTPAPPVNGEWGPWGPYTECTGGCGSGSHSRSRVCDNPAPSNGGQYCQGASTVTESCADSCGTFDAKVKCNECDWQQNPHGYFGDDCSCKHYWQCYPTIDGWGAYRRSCSDCTMWSQDILTCIRDPDYTGPGCETVHNENVVINGGRCTRGNLEYEIIPDDLTMYKMVTHDFLPPTVMRCPPGTGFDLTSCLCQSGVANAIAGKREFCLPFDLGYNGFGTVGGTYVDPRDVTRTSSGVDGYAGVFNGVSSRIEIPFFTNNEFAKFSFSLWYRRTGSSSGLQGLVYNGDCKNNGSIRILSESQTEAGAYIRTTTTEAKITGAGASYDDWHHVVQTYDGATMKLFIDNTLVGSDNAYNPTYRNKCPLILGHAYNAITTQGWFEGLMDEVCFYKDALTENEIDDLFKLKTVV